MNIPVKLYSATKPKQFSFHLFCSKCKTKLKYKRWCPKCSAEIPWDKVVYGFELSKGEWKILTREQIAKLKPAKSDQVEILGFTSLEAFDPIYFEKHYYVVPAKEKEKAYFLLKTVLQTLAKVAFCRIVLREKEYIAILRAYKEGMLLTTLYYDYEIRSMKEFAELKEKVSATKKEFELAKKLVASFIREPKIEEYEDSFEKKLKEVILGKVKKEEIKPKPEKLIEALELTIKMRRKKK